MQQYFKNLSDSIISASERRGKISARAKYALEAALLGQSLFSTDHPVAWCGVVAPFDLLHAMGVNSCFVEFVGAVLASTGMVESFLEKAEQEGYSTDLCSYHRAVNGAAFQSLMPEPDFLVATSSPCSSGLSTVEHLAEYYKKDLFLLHIPQSRNADAVTYLADQLRDMVAFVSDHTARKMDPENLRQVMVNTNKMRDALKQVYEMAGAVPTPARRKDMINVGYLALLLMGTENGIELAETYRDEFTRKMENHEQGVPGEQVRLLWYQNRIQFENPLEKILEDEFRAAVVVDELNDINWDPIDPDDPYEGLAQRVLRNPLVGHVSNRIEHLIHLMEKYRIDGLINPCHWGCRQGTGPRGLVTKELQKAGIPVLNLEVDCVDPRNFSAGQVRTRIEAFIETILSRKAGRTG